MEPGVLIRYTIRWRGIPIRWTTRIQQWEAPHQFVDMQLSGPYKLWHHTHRFEAVGNGTRITDVVRYELPLGFLGTIAHRLFVKRDVERIFDYRQERIAKRFGEAKAA